jgi:hypothetical protein
MHNNNKHKKEEEEEEKVVVLILGVAPQGQASKQRYPFWVNLDPEAVGLYLNLGLE